MDPLSRPEDDASDVEQDSPREESRAQMSPTTVSEPAVGRASKGLAMADGTNFSRFATEHAKDSLVGDQPPSPKVKEQ